MNRKCTLSPVVRFKLDASEPRYTGQPEMRFAMYHFSIAPTMRRLVAGALTALSLVMTGVMAATPAQEIRLQENAPDRYVVQRGDTLWSIAAKFLKEPHLWPQIWRMNQEQIRNPNRIYPGDVIVLDRSKPAPQLSLVDSVKLSPTVRVESLGREAIPAIPPKAIEPFLTQPLVIEAGGLDKAPRIVGTEENRVHLGSGGIAYVTGIGEQSGSVWQVYRAGKPLIDPDTRATLGYEAIYLGTAKVIRAGDPATIEIISASQEISNGDRLIATRPENLKAYVPRSPATFIRGRIIGLYNGISTSETGRDAIVTINKGKRDGIEDGHVLSIARAGNTIVDPQSTKSRDAAPTFRLPDERYGTLYVFRVFDAVSYALVMDSSRPVAPADIVHTP